MARLLSIGRKRLIYNIQALKKDKPAIRQNNHFSMKLIDPYLPADYSDCISKRIKPDVSLSPDEIFEQMFCNFPKPVELLMWLRNRLVKPLELQGGGSFRDLVAERNDAELLICKQDRHLCFWASIYCSHPEEGWQTVSASTAVKYCNFMGRLYFAVIKVFHKVLMARLFRKAIRTSLR